MLRLARLALLVSLCVGCGGPRTAGPGAGGSCALGSWTVAWTIAPLAEDPTAAVPSHAALDRFVHFEVGPEGARARSATYAASLAGEAAQTAAGCEVRVAAVHEAPIEGGGQDVTRIELVLVAKDGAVTGRGRLVNVMVAEGGEPTPVSKLDVEAIGARTPPGAPGGLRGCPELCAQMAGCGMVAFDGAAACRAECEGSIEDPVSSAVYTCYGRAPDCNRLAACASVVAP